MSDPKGYLSLVLHAHLPFIRHPESNDFLEEDWFYEAMVETYAPLLMRFERLKAEGVPFQISMVISPPLATMMEDDLLRDRLKSYLEKRIHLLESECQNNKNSSILKCASHYLNEFKSVYSFIFEFHYGRILNSVRSLMHSGHLEILTCTATHGYLPLMNSPAAWRGQIQTAVRSHQYFFGRSPKGIWLAECGYDHGVESVLSEAGIEYFFVDAHGIAFGEPQPVFGVYQPVITDAGVNVFARDPESSKQVWSAEEGYPGDSCYREFYRDLGYDADLDYLRPYLHGDHVRRGIGIKYHRITGKVPLNQKDYYDPEVATQKAAEHAGNFMFNRQAQVRFLSGKTQHPPIMVAPYDAELFGHWWYEGPQFLEFLIRKMAFDQSDVKLISGSSYLQKFPVRQIQKPNPSSWGSEGHSLVWVNGDNAYLYRHQHWAESEMEKLVSQFSHAEGDLKRALNQCLREILLMQSSDWAFIMTTKTTVSYATRRFTEHLDRFHQLRDQIHENRLNLEYLRDCEERDNIFPIIDFHDFSLIKN